MARDSIGRQVARAASTGGRKPGVQRTFETFHLVVIAIIVLGVSLVIFSRWEAHHGATANSTPPTSKDTWLNAVAFDICGTVQPDLPANPNLYGAGTSKGATKAATPPPSSGKIQLGLYTQGDGLIHIHPLTRADAGDNATLGRFVSRYPGMALSATEVRYPGGKLLRNGDRCGSQPGKVQVEMWTDTLSATKGQIVAGNPTDLKLGKDQLLTIAFVTKGATIPRPPQASITTMLNASASTTTTAPSAPASPLPSSPLGTNATIPGSAGQVVPAPISPAPTAHPATTAKTTPTTSHK